MSLFRSTFLSLSEANGLRHFAEHSSMAHKVSRRFVAGVSIQEALSVCREANRLGLSVTLDSLGENVRNEAQARANGVVYHTLLNRIAEKRLDANVSLKLTQLGLDLGEDIAESIVGDLSQRAHILDNFVRVDMEGSAYTELTLRMVRRLHGTFGINGSIGVVVQAYLYRTAQDVDNLIADGIRIRLCKGAYREPENVAFPAKRDVDANYVKLMKELLNSGIFHGIATHDETIIRKTQEFATEKHIDRSRFEFQMLYGVRRDLQESLVKQGYRVRVYVPFGGDWYPYFMRRIAERPANAIFIARNLFR